MVCFCGAWVPVGSVTLVEYIGAYQRHGQSERKITVRVSREMKECPKCELVSPDSSEHCECGYTFSSGLVPPSHVAAKRMIRMVIKIVAGAAGLCWLITPTTQYNGLVVFVVSSLVLLACFAALRIMDDDADKGFWP